MTPVGIKPFCFACHKNLKISVLLILLTFFFCALWFVYADWFFVPTAVLGSGLGGGGG